MLMIMLTLAVGERAGAVSFALDSIAEWGRFPRFCVNVYRWGDKFFNSYDSTHVLGTGYKFNVKVKTDSWTDFYDFRLPDEMSIIMTSRPSTSAGIYLTYLAVSAGYDVNVSNLLTGNDHKRERFNFGFNCSLFSADFYYIHNDGGTTIRHLGKRGLRFNENVSFDGINTEEWVVQLCYFFNHKRYSQAAAFNFSKIQTKSQGSFYAGLSISDQKYDFNFNCLPQEWLKILPDTWPGRHYKVDTYQYVLKFGYGYIWVFARNWVLGVSESPLVGMRHGRITGGEISNSFALANRFNLSLVWNNRHWFAGAVGTFDANIFPDKTNTFVAAILTFEASIGYRFNLW